MVLVIDVLLMIVEIIGMELLVYIIDGFSILLFFIGEIEVMLFYEVFFYYYGWEFCCVWSGDWKLVFFYKYWFM